MFVGRCSEKNCKLGFSLWDKCLVRQDLIINFIFIVPPNFFICDVLMLALSKIVRILPLDPNVFQQLSKIFQSRKAYIN